MARVNKRSTICEYGGRYWSTAEIENQHSLCDECPCTPSLGRSGPSPPPRAWVASALLCPRKLPKLSSPPMFSRLEPPPSRGVITLPNRPMRSSSSCDSHANSLPLHPPAAPFAFVDRVACEGG